VQFLAGGLGFRQAWAWAHVVAEVELGLGKVLSLRLPTDGDEIDGYGKQGFMRTVAGCHLVG
jgi:hypothetical protein